MTPSHERRTRSIIEGAEILLPNRGFGEGHNFMLSTEEALAIGDAVATRNHQKLRDILAGAIEQLEDHYDSFGVDDLKKEWEVELQRVTGMEGDFLEYIDDPTHTAALNDVLAGRIDGGRTRIELRPIAYVKLLETLALASAPEGLETFNPRFATAARYRKSQYNIYARSLHTIDRLAESEPGVRDIREKLLSKDESALDKYLTDLSLMRVAQKAYANIIELQMNGGADAARELIRFQLETANGFNELLGTHVLNWEMLPSDIANSPDRNRAIKQLVNDRAESNEKQIKVHDTWSDERIDVLFDTAHLATSQGRHADIYVSSTFDSGTGVYLAVALTHPLEADKLIVVADNPLKGNALYIVDEQLTEFDDDGRQYGWRDVLGTHKRIARDRGARRRYHTGDWSQLPRAVCEYGGNHKLATEKRQRLATQTSEAKDTEAHDVRAGMLAAIARADEITRSLSTR